MVHVARRRWSVRASTLPLLIGGATASTRAHRGEDRPALRRPGGLRARRLARAWAWRKTCWAKELEARLRGPKSTAEYDEVRRAARRRSAQQPRRRWPRRGPTASSWTGPATAPPAPELHRRHGSEKLRPGRHSPSTSTGGRSSRPGIWPATSPPSWTTRWSARPRRSLYADAQAMLKQIVEEPLAASPRRAGLLTRPTAWATTSRSTPTRAASQVATTWYGLRQQTEKSRMPKAMRPNRCLADFVAPKESGMADYVGAFAVTAGIGSREKRSPRTSKPTATTTAASCSRRWPTAWPKPSPNACTSACAPRFWGYAADEALEQRGADRQSSTRHPPGPGYPACPDHTDKGDPVRPAARPR